VFSVQCSAFSVRRLAFRVRRSAVTREQITTGWAVKLLSPPEAAHVEVDVKRFLFTCSIVLRFTYLRIFHMPRSLFA
jgi:hypothetical protein